MAKSISRKKRNKLTVILLSPILIIVFIVGWSLYWIGQSGKPKTKQPQKPINKTLAEQSAEVELVMIPQQEEQILAN